MIVCVVVKHVTRANECKTRREHSLHCVVEGDAVERLIICSRCSFMIDNPKNAALF